MDFAAEPKRAEACILVSMQAEDRKGAGRKPKLQPKVDIGIGSKPAFPFFSTLACVLFFALLFFAGCRQPVWDRLSSQEKATLQGILEHWQTWVPAREKEGTAPLMTFAELYQGLGTEEQDFLDRVRGIKPSQADIEKSLQLLFDQHTEDYSIRSHKKELISAILLRLLRLMISTKPDFQQGGMIVTLLVPNIYTQHDVFEMLNELRHQTGNLLSSLEIDSNNLYIEYETISESDAAFMGYQQTHADEVNLSNGEIALVIDCGKGTTDISMLLADNNENYSSFFRTGFAGAGNVLLYGFAEDFLSQPPRACMPTLPT